MKYIYAGFSKCGTKTLAKVFRLLGFKVFDIEETILYCGDLWLEFFETMDKAVKNQILRKILDNVDVVLDLPYYFFWKEILDVFPEAKVVFYERDEDEWFDSNSGVFFLKI